jgi:hypothetical protein
VSLPHLHHFIAQVTDTTDNDSKTGLVGCKRGHQIALLGRFWHSAHQEGLLWLLASGIWADSPKLDEASKEARDEEGKEFRGSWPLMNVGTVGMGRWWQIVDDLGSSSH